MIFINNYTLQYIKENISFGLIYDSQIPIDVCYSNVLPICDENGHQTGVYKKPASKVDSINGNIRVYPYDIYRKALEDIKNEGFPFAGTHPHPTSYVGLDGKVTFDIDYSKQAIKIIDAYIDELNIVWIEFKPLKTQMGRIISEMIQEGLVFGLSNRMSGELEKQLIDRKEVFVAKSLKILTWDVVSNPAETNTLIKPININNSKILNQHKNNYTCNNLYENNHDKENQKIFSPQKNENNCKEKGVNKMNFQNEEKKEAQKQLKDSVEKLDYDNTTKENIIHGGAYISDKNEVNDYIHAQKRIIDSAVISSNLNNLGIKSIYDGKASIISDIKEAEPWKPIVNNIMNAFDNDNIKNNRYTSYDSKLRNANLKIFDNMFNQMKSNKQTKPIYSSFIRALKDSADTFSSKGTLSLLSSITDSEFSGSTQYGNTAVVSLAILQQIFQDLKFLQLVMVETFGGKNYKIPVEFRSNDIYTQDIFGGIGEFEGVPSEGIETYLIEFTSEWLKRSFIISKEAEIEQLKGPFAYDVIARNTAALTERFQRVLDSIISTEMLATSDEYECIRVTNETISPILSVVKGTDVPNGSNAVKLVKLKCGATRDNESITPNIVRPRKNTYLNSKGRTENEITNEIILKASSNTYKRGYWDAINGMIRPIYPDTTADYAVDFENGNIYFSDSSISDMELKATYSYVTNISYFDTKVSDNLLNFPARYYNKLIEMIDDVAALMGSAPRFSRPEFLIGSLKAMTYYRKAELFYNKSLPSGTCMTEGDMWFARRAQIDIGEHNSPWIAGDHRLLIGAKNRTRLGIGSPLALEGPFPYIDKITGKYTTAKEWVASQQYVVATPVVIDENGKQHNPPYRTIKLY